MGLLRRLFSFLFKSDPPATAAPEALRPAPAWPDGWGYLGAVGESQYQPALWRVASANRVCWATLLPEPDNPFDGNAVAVLVENETVGYLTRADARRYRRRLLALSEPMQVPAKVIGGTRDKPFFGVLLGACPSNRF